MNNHNGLRRENRVGAKSKALMTWMDETGNPMTSRGECIDVSPSGIRILIVAKIPIGTVVQVQAPDMRVHGSACVRTCSRDRMDYIVGLEFVGGFQWSAEGRVPKCYD